MQRLAEVSGVSEAHFARSFRQAFGIPPHRYLLTRRIEQATTLLRDTNRDGTVDERSDLLTGLTSPFGMALVGERLYVANADAIVSVPYQAGQTASDAVPVKLVDLPGGPLTIAWPEGGSIEMTGPAALSFEGSFEDADFPA